MGLTSLTLPNTLKTIGTSVFGDCVGLTSLRLPNSLKSVGVCTFELCRKLTYVSFPHSLRNVDVHEFAFDGYIALSSVDFRSMSRPALIVWAVGNSHNRDNWELTSVMRLCNVLSLITVFALESRDVVSTLDPDGIVFTNCPCGVPFDMDTGHVDLGCEDAEFDRHVHESDRRHRHST